MERKNVEFRGSIVMSIIPMLILLAFCISYFIIFRVFDMGALALGGFIGLLVGALFTKTYGQYWDAVMRGIGSPVSVAIVVILLVIGMFSKLMAVSGVSQGFVWLADQIGMQGGIFTAFTFVATCLVASATGSSIGTLFTAFPVLYPAGILLGADPGFLAGAILSGAIFGDNLAPISDVTIASTSTQTYANREGTADIGGTVAYRLKYALIAGTVSTILFAVFGGGGVAGTGAEEILEASMNVSGLIMLIPVVILLIVAIKTRDIFKSVTAGIISGIVMGLAVGVFTVRDIFSITDGHVTGFLYDGFSGMIGICLFCISLFGIMGVLNESGMMASIIRSFCSSKMARTKRGTEILIALGSTITTILLGGVTSASVLTFGPVVNELGAAHKIHPYRRANLLSGYANGFAAIIPFISAFVFITSVVVAPLREQYTYIPAINPVDIFKGCFYPMILFFVLTYSIISGWDRKYESEEGKVV